jgi:hypothetical protein
MEATSPRKFLIRGMANPNFLITLVGNVTYSSGGKITDLRSTTKHGNYDSITEVEKTYLA